MSEPLRVDPVELRITANAIDARSGAFGEAHQQAGSGAGSARLGRGLAGGGLPQMSAAWEDEDTSFGQR